MHILDNVNFDEFQAIKFALEQQPVHPATNTNSRVYFNTTDEIVYYKNSGGWVPLTASVRSVTPGDGLSNSGTAIDPILNVNTDGVTIEIVGDTIRIKDGGVSTSKLADLAVSTAKVANGAVTFQKIQDIPTMTVLGRVVGGNGSASAITILNDLSSADSQTLITSGGVKAYVDASIASIGSLVGGYSASGTTTLPGGSGTKKGDYWYVTAAGTVQGQIFNVGDVIVANKANPTNTNAADYVFLESNRDVATTTVLGLVRLATNQEILDGVGSGVITAESLVIRTATETRLGLVMKASDAEFAAGLDNSKFVTTQQVKGLVSGLSAYSGLLGNGSATSITMTHGLNTLNVVPALYRVSTGELVFTTMFASTVNTFVVNFGRPPASNEYKLVLSSR